MSHLSPDRETTASQAPLIVYGSDEERHQLWKERTGQAQPADLSDTFAVQWGKHGEPFVLDWIERTGAQKIIERQRFVPHPTLPKIGATLDGYRPFDNAVIEVKVLSPFTAAVEFEKYYSPQVAVQIACRGAGRGFLAVQQGNSEPQLFEVLADASYIDGVLAFLLDFQRCVDQRVPPGPVPAAPVPPERWRQVSLDADTLPNWGPDMKQTLEVWQRTRAVAEQHGVAKAGVKALLPPDVGRVTFGTIAVKRARNNAVTIVEGKAA